MKKLLMTMTLAFAITSVSAPAFAGDYHSKFFNFSQHIIHKFYEAIQNSKTKDNQHQVQAVPEIDGGQAGLALALLAGMVAVARERKRRV